MSKRMEHCTDCGKVIIHKVYPNGLCEGCYNYYRKGGTVNPIPKPGTITYDHRGFVVCHICGKAYKRLGSHARESHSMSVAEYKEAYGLCNNARTTEKAYSSKMRGHSYANDMPNQLIKTGVNTRIKQGETKLRYGKKSRLQECLDRSKRYSQNKK